MLAAPVAAQSIHPLDPLSRDEMARASSLVRADGRFQPTMRFATLGLKEPGKRAVLGWPSAPVAREALALVDIRVLDHCIVADNGCLSFAERGLL